MTMKRYIQPACRVVEVTVEDMIATSPGVVNEVGDSEILIKEREAAAAAETAETFGSLW